MGKVKETRRKKSKLRQHAESLAFTILLALLLRSFVVQAFRIPSGSMEDTLLVGDFLLAEKLSYGPLIPFTGVRLPGLREPRPGDIIIFKFPGNPHKDFIKRVIAVGGQVVEIRNKRVYVDGKEVPPPPKAKFLDPNILPREVSTRDNFGPVRVPKGYLFVMGDNRDNSLDSRYWGFVPLEEVKAKALIIYFSWNNHCPIWDVAHKIRWWRIGRIIR